MTTSAFFILPILFRLIMPLVDDAAARPLAPDVPVDAEAQAWIDNTFQSLTIEEKVGQLVFPVTYTDKVDLQGERYKEVMRNVQELHVGGYLTFRGDVFSAAQLIRQAQEQAKVPLLVTADLEGGVGLVMRGATRFPKAMAIGATFDTNNAYQTGRITAIEAQAVGLHVNFYPVVDVNNNPGNPIINIRSFGADPLRVADMARAYIRGSQEQGVWATAKHFPGHGDTATDSHLDLPVIQAGRERLEAIELPPFKAAIESGVGAVMTAHLFIPALEPEKGLPATLSPAILNDLLRKQLGFAGLVFTDAMNMGGIVKKYKQGDAAVRAFNAGADVILFPASVPDAYQGLLAAARSGEIKEERLNQAVRKILETKARLGIHRGGKTDTEQVAKMFPSKEHAAVAQGIMDRAVTLVRDDKSVLPFKDIAKDEAVLLLTILDDRRRQETRGAAFVKNMRERHPKIIHREVSSRTPAAEIQAIREQAGGVDRVVIGAYVRIAAFKGSVGLGANQLELLRGLARLDKPLAFVLFGSPYLLAAVPEIPTYVLTYEDYTGAEEAAAKAILGEIPFRGKLPVNLPGFYEIGHGIQK